MDEDENDSPAFGTERQRAEAASVAEIDEMAATIASTLSHPEGDSLPRDGVLSGLQVKSRGLTREELVAWWRDARQRLAAALTPLDAKARLPWVGPDMSARSFATARLMECWSHGLDALEAAGVQPVDSDRLKHIAHLGYATRQFAYLTRDMEPPEDHLYVELQSPSGQTWIWGDSASAAGHIKGTVGDFCRVVTQRIHYTNTALKWDSEPAEDFLRVAQTFAGPPGEGRPPKGS